MEIQKLLKDTSDISHTVSGWVKHHRSQGKIQFIDLHQGDMHILQCVYASKISSLPVNTAIQVKGKLQKGKHPGSVELAVDEFEILATSESLPFSKDVVTTTLRQWPELRMRTDLMRSIQRIRHQAIMATHLFFDEQGFVNLHTPLITASDCEGAGETFKVSADIDPEFFTKQAYLTVSGQLEGEAGALALGKIYTFGPTFRAEKSQTSRHLAEFWMIEPEVAFADLSDIIDLAIRYVKYVMKYVIDHCKLEYEVLSSDLVTQMTKLVDSSFKVVTYTQAIQDLQDSSHEFKEAPYWGMDMGSEHERYLCEVLYDSPTVVKDYPKDIKAFYMHENDDGKTVACMDMLVPGIGELIGGSQRECRYEVLKTKMDKLGLHYPWYLDLRKYGGATHSGWGLGFDRLLMMITGMDNVREVVPWPRTWGTCI